MTKKKFKGTFGFLHFELDDSTLKSMGLLRKNLGTYMRGALEAMARHWHRVYLPQHFQETAYERYRYGKRKGMDKSGIRERAIKNLNNAFRITQGRSGEVTAERIEAEVERVYNRTYTRRKERKFRHNKPLNYTGDGMREALSGPKIRGNSKQVRVILPNRFNWKSPYSRINMRDELTRVLKDEVMGLVKVGRVAMRDEIMAHS